MEINIVKSDDIKTDYANFIGELHKKFKFEDVIKFQEEFLNLIDKIKINGPNDNEELALEFKKLLYKHSSKKDLSDEVKKELQIMRANNGD